MQTSAIPSVRKTIRVAAVPARAFDIFTAGMHQWWPRAHSLNQKVERAAIVAEPRVGGRWYERAVDGTECNWGKVLAWEPPHRVLFGWQLDQNWQYSPDFLTEVEIRFDPAGEGATEVTLEHRNLERYGVFAETIRPGLDSNDGWMGGLTLYAALIASQPASA